MRAVGKGGGSGWGFLSELFFISKQIISSDSGKRVKESGYFEEPRISEATGIWKGFCYFYCAAAP